MVSSSSFRYQAFLVGVEEGVPLARRQAGVVEGEAMDLPLSEVVVVAVYRLLLKLRPAEMLVSTSLILGRPVLVVVLQEWPQSGECVYVSLYKIQCLL